MRAALAAATAVLALSPSGCGSSETECTCTVENAGQRRIIACGASACIAEVTLACIDAETTAERGNCTAPAPAPTEPAGTPALPPPEPDRSCENLLRFCDSRCNGPSSAAVDCRSTATSGDPAACAAWPLGTGILCRP